MQLNLVVLIVLRMFSLFWLIEGLAGLATAATISRVPMLPFCSLHIRLALNRRGVACDGPLCLVSPSLAERGTENSRGL